ncbi:hypothetical protein ACFE04_029730 [Oxalis oulophora]
MEPGYGLAIVKHGGILTFTGTKYKYDGGLTEEMVLDSDRVSYAEMKGILMDKGHVEANFKIYFKVGVNLKILHSDQSSIEFGECIRNNGEVLVFVAHVEGINSDYIPFNNGSDSGRNTEVIGSQGGNDNTVGVGLDDIKDDDLGFDEIDRLIDENNSGKYDTSSDSDDSFDEYDGKTYDSEDDELCVARENMRKATEKKSDLRSLSKIVKEIEIVDSKKKKFKEKCDEDLTQHMDFDVDSSDSYDIESEDEICRRRKSKLQKFYTRHQEIKKWKDPFGPRVKKQLEINKVIGAHFKVDPNGAGQFEVIDGKRTFVVNLVNRKCTCRRWCLKGVPCFHACASIFKNHEDPAKYVHSLLSKETCLTTYNHMLIPIVGPMDWPKTELGDVVPPPEWEMKGRPPTESFQR